VTAANVTELAPYRQQRVDPIAAALGEAVKAAIVEAVERRDDGSCISLKEAARRLDVHPNTVTRLVREGQLRMVSVFSAKKVRLVDLLAYLDRQKL